MIEDTDESVTSIDLAVTFFACVIMLFVFIKFTFLSGPSHPLRPTIGQTVKVVEAIPPSWSAVVRRSAHSILRGGVLDIFSSEAVAGAIDGSLPLTPKDRPSVTVFLKGRGIPDPAPPNAFVIGLSLDPGVLPNGWRRAAIVPGPEALCPLPEEYLLTVWIDDASGSLGPTIDWAARCGLNLRYEHLRHTDSGRHAMDIGLTPDAFSRATIFR